MSNKSLILQNYVLQGKNCTRYNLCDNIGIHLLTLLKGKNYTKLKINIKKTMAAIVLTILEHVV